jgi:hypothetical protein
MGTTQGRGKLVMLLIGAAACVVWLSWVVSPEVEEPPAVIAAAEPAPTPVVASTKPAPAQPQPAPQTVEPEPSAPEETKPERIPTPHPMSLDQSKPPEQFGELAELKKQYASESRDDKSSTTEAALRKLIDTPNIPSELVQDITCRRDLCKIEAHWTPRRRIGFAVLLESSKNLYSQRVAVEPARGPSPDGSYLTTLYIRVK